MRIPHADGLFKGAIIALLLMIFTGPAQGAGQSDGRVERRL